MFWSSNSIHALCTGHLCSTSPGVSSRNNCNFFLRSSNSGLCANWYHLVHKFRVLGCSSWTNRFWRPHKLVNMLKWTLKEMIWSCINLVVPDQVVHSLDGETHDHHLEIKQWKYFICTLYTPCKCEVWCGTVQVSNPESAFMPGTFYSYYVGFLFLLCIQKWFSYTRLVFTRNPKIFTKSNFLCSQISS